MSALVQRYAEMAVPRYTSYPTAAEFTACVGPAEHATWLETLDPNRTVSLYVHVPYCREICHSCGCTTKMVLRDEVLANYMRILREEIDRVGRHVVGRRDCIGAVRPRRSCGQNGSPRSWRP